MSTVHVLIPVYRTQLNDAEWCSLQQCENVLGHYPISLIAPEGLDLTPIQTRFPRWGAQFFAPSYFDGRMGYNHLMLSEELYRRFAAWDYVLIYQTDAFVFRDELQAWCDRGYDYVGAPWPIRWLYKSPMYRIISYLKSRCLNVDHSQRHIHRGRVGNGGFSLRKTASIAALLAAHPDRVSYYKKHCKDARYYEDVFFAVEAPALEASYQTAPRQEAFFFSFDTYPWIGYRHTGRQLPFGCHAYARRSRRKFWRPFFAPYMEL